MPRYDLKLILVHLLGDSLPQSVQLRFRNAIRGLRVGHAAINAGADLMLHHAHILKGMEVYKGKVVVYSMCNFAMDVATYENRMAQLNRNPKQRERVKFYSYTPDPSYLAMLFLTTLVRA